MRLRSSAAVDLPERAPPVARVPAELEILPRDAERPAPMREAPGSDIREFRAALIGRMPDARSGPMTIVVAAADADRGGEQLAADLAIASAQVGYEVLLVDANIATPRQHARFAMPNDHGVSDMAAWMGDGSDGVARTPVRRLSLIAAGPAVANPAEAIERLGLCQRLAKLGRRFDMIVVDAAAQPLADAAAGAVGSDGVIVVVRRHRTSISAVRRVTAAFADRGVAALGTVVVP